MINPLIECVRREIRLRHSTYPHLIKNGKMTDDEASQQIQLMSRVLATLQTVQRLTTDARDLVEMIGDANDLTRVKASATLQRVIDDLKTLPDFAQVGDARQLGLEHPQVDDACSRIRKAATRDERDAIFRSMDHITDPRLRCLLRGATAAWELRNTPVPEGATR